MFSVFDGSGRVGFASLRGNEAQIVSVTQGALSSQTAAASSSSGSMGAGAGGAPFPTGESSVPSQATATGVVGGGSLPTPSASGGVVSNNPSLQTGSSSGSSSGGSSSGGNNSGANQLGAMVAMGGASMVAALAGAFLVL